MQVHGIHSLDDARDHPQDRQVDQAQPAEREGAQPDRAQQVLRPLAETGQKLDRQEVQKTLDEAAYPVLRPAELPRPMRDGDLAHAKAAGRRQHGHEAVQLAVEPDFPEHFAAIALHAAVVVVQLHARQRADHPIEQPRGEDFEQRIVPDPLPAADHVEVALHFGEKAGNLTGIVLQIGVEGHHQVAAGGLDARTQRRGLAEIAAKTQPREVTVGRRQPANHLPRAVGRAVVDEHRVELVALCRSHLGKLLPERLQAFGLVQDGHDYGKHKGRGSGQGGGQGYRARQGLWASSLRGWGAGGGTLPVFVSAKMGLSPSTAH